jgi:hypothetical protein
VGERARLRRVAQAEGLAAVVAARLSLVHGGLRAQRSEYVDADGKQLDRVGTGDPREAFSKVVARAGAGDPRSGNALGQALNHESSCSHFLGGSDV